MSLRWHSPEFAQLSGYEWREQGCVEMDSGHSHQFDEFVDDALAFADSMEHSSRDMNCACVPALADQQAG